MRLTISLLGRFEAARDGQPLAFAMDAARALLAYLAVEADQPHPREYLATMFWPEHSQAAASSNLRTTLYRLRKPLESASEHARQVIVQPSKFTLQFSSEAATTDVACFEQLLAGCVAHTRSGTSATADAKEHAIACAECIGRLEQAAALYRGDFLQGLTLDDAPQFEEWKLFKREQLRAQMLDVLDTLARHYESLGRIGQMREYAAHQLALDPWCEEAYAQVMRALAYAGDRAAALAQFEACRRLLQTELGIEPTNDLRELAARIRSGDGLGRAPASSGTPAPALKHNLPEHLTAFVGRERELDAVIAYLRGTGNDPTARLLTLVGPGGMGKTRLAIEAARRCTDAFPDGAFFVSLAPLSSPDGIVPAIAAAIGLSLQGGDPKQQLLDAVRARRLLLVLDNFEHIIAGASIAADVLQASANSQVIVTSRERLNVQGERTHTVEGLDYVLDGAGVNAQSSSAVRLFVQSARRAQPAFRLDDDALPGVVRICERVGGMPLGLELAAAWTESLSPAEIASEIERSADFLAFDWRDVPERQRSLRAVFDWSWRLLSEAERAALCRLSVFRGGFTRHAAQAAADADLRALSTLLRKSLVRRGEDGRYEMHELLRQFAAERLEAMPDARDAIVLRHSVFYLDFVAQRERRLARSAAREACHEIRADLDNVRQAWRWAARGWHPEAVDALNRSAYAFWQFLWTIGAWEECAGAFRAACEGGERASRDAGQEAATPQATHTLSRLTAMHASQLLALGKHDEALHAASRAITLAQHSAEAEGEALGILVQGQVLRRTGRSDEARAVLERAARLASERREYGAASELMLLVESQAYDWLCHITLTADDCVIAGAYAERGRTLAHAQDRTREELIFPTDLADIDLITGDLPAAKGHAEAALRLARALDDMRGLEATNTLLATVEERSGHYAHALELWMHSLMISRQIGDTLSQLSLMCNLGHLHTLLGNYPVAEQYLDDTARRLSAMDSAMPEFIIRLLPLALLNHYTGQHDQALAHAEQAWHMAQSHDSGFNQARALLLMGRAQAALSRLTDGADCFAQALAIFTRLGHSYCAVEAEAGLALVALSKDDSTGAMAHAEAILRVLGVQPWVGIDTPFFVYLACYRTLDATGDVRAEAVLQAGHALLQACAGRIADEALRRSFLEDVPANRELAQLAADLLVPGD
jgi:predicted ATPase/DNA-binding SARP family transcriptional activator